MDSLWKARKPKQAMIAVARTMKSLCFREKLMILGIIVPDHSLKLSLSD